MLDAIHPWGKPPLRLWLLATQFVAQVASEARQLDAHRRLRRAVFAEEQGSSAQAAMRTSTMSGPFRSLRSA